MIIATQVEQPVDAEEAGVTKILVEEDKDVDAKTERTATADAITVGTPRRTTELTAPFASHSSRQMKRRTLMLHRLGLWDELKGAGYIRNRMPTDVLAGKAPLEVLWSKPLGNMKHMH